MIYFGYPLDIHGWKTKSEIKPENRGWEIIPKPEPADPKPTYIRPEPDPLPSLTRRGVHSFLLFFYPKKYICRSEKEDRTRLIILHAPVTKYYQPTNQL
jgi:hypothetical protein